ncbi:sugar ABC transporter substrate-binding protein [Paenibacillus sp. BSR1-1]|uniref:sugar ABC transporter substrate-binding protein n=1 Tax=Paenibacillus sp. BSR1-1 TaxID=3020845 RepID=UPI0025B0BA14|nr:sugar ABC transporter substrate-binding protein [Paenibacillus sp. BSR1-1]MDN3019420.1 sugar ABC transporter substrate-binding protein [Paenibacillus sp. BSR1-1]
MKKLFKSLVCSVALVTGLVGCSSASNSSGSGNSDSTSKDKQLVVGVTLSQMSDPFFVNVKQGIFDQAKKDNVKVVFADGQANTATQLSQVEDFVSKQVDLIVLNPTEADPLVPAVKEANNAGIPVITFDRWVTGGKTVTHVGASAIEIGAQAGEALFEYLGGKGKIAVIEHIPGASTTIDRTKGLDEALKKYPGIKVVARQSATSRAEAMSVMENILTANPDIDGVYAYNDDNALGASDAIIAAKKQDKIVVTGVGGTAPALDAVKQGKLLATVDILPLEEGKLAIKTAVDVLKGKKITEQHEGRTWVLQQSKVVNGPQWDKKK